MSSVSCWGTTPIRALIRGPSSTGSMPSTVSVPSVTGETQPIIRIVEVLPAPFGPRKPNDSPGATSKSIASTAVNSPNRLVRPRAWMREGWAGAGGAGHGTANRTGPGRRTLGGGRGRRRQAHARVERRDRLAPGEVGPAVVDRQLRRSEDRRVERPEVAGAGASRSGGTRNASAKPSAVSAGSSSRAAMIASRSCERVLAAYSGQSRTCGGSWRPASGGRPAGGRGRGRRSRRGRRGRRA